MNKFDFYNTSNSVEISLIEPKLHYIKGYKIKLTFYNSLTEVCSIMFNNENELFSFIFEIKFFIDDYSTSLESKDLIPVILYSSIPNENGIYYNLTLNYKYYIDSPTENDDILQFSIYNIDSIHRKSTIIILIELREETMDQFISFIYNFLENNNIDVISKLEEQFDIYKHKSLYLL